MKRNDPAPLAATRPWWQHYDIAALFAFILISAYWFYQANYTWDDDAMTRYFNTQEAGRRPVLFIDSWNRPLFVLLFYYPVLLFGKAGVAWLMTLLTAASGYLISRCARNLGYPDYQMGAVFMVFQTFLFGITRDAMTEPLAAFFISLGLWLFSTRNWFWLSIVGGLLPLARTELIILLVFWVVPLLQHRKYFYILLLGWGLLAWWLSWFIYTGDGMAFFRELLKSGAKENRYERISVFHHLNKYVYVLGVMVFFFLFLGFITSRIRMFFQQSFIYLQYLAGFLLYVVFAVYLDLGQSGGALRNLITLSPFAALISLRGLNYWVNSWKLPKTANPAAAGINPPSREKKNTKPPGNEMYRLLITRTVIILYCIALLLVTAEVLTHKLISRQYYDPEEKDYTILLLVIACVLIVISPFYFVAGRIARAILFTGIIAVQVAFTLYYEHPYSHKSTERAEMNQMAAMMNVPAVNNGKVYCNYLWYCWTSGRNVFDTSRNGRIDSASLNNAPNGSYFLWEPHYTNQHYTNIPLTMLATDTTFLPVLICTTEMDELASILFMKWKPLPGDHSNPLEGIAKELDNHAVFHYLYGGYLRDRQHNYTQSLASLNKAISLNPSMKDAYLHRAITLYNLQNREAACTDIRTAMTMGAADAYRYGKQMGCLK